MRAVGVVGAICAAAIGLVACGPTAPEDGQDWPSPSEIVRRIDDNCVLVGAEARCWARVVSSDDDREVELMRMLRDELAPVPLPVLDVGTGADVMALASLPSSRCAAIAGAGVKCWGDNGGSEPSGGWDDHLALPGIEGRLGDDPSERGDALPFVDLALRGDVELVEARRNGSGYCVLDSVGVKCWGGAPEYLGSGATETLGDEASDMGESLPYLDLGSDFLPAGLSVGQTHACAWSVEGAVKCWGDNTRGQLGVEPLGGVVGDEPGEMGDILPTVELGVDAMQVAVGYAHTCVLTVDGRVKCWGANSTEFEGDDEHAPQDPMRFPTGALGVGDADDRVAPVDDVEFVDLGPDAVVVAIDAALHSTCALLDDGALKCWGRNQWGQLGQGDEETRGDEPGEMGLSLLPIDLGKDRTARSFDLHGGTACALLDERSIKCWGFGTKAGEVPDSMGDALQPVIHGDDLPREPDL